MRISPHFKRSEHACKCGCGFAAVDLELNSVLEDVSDRFDGAPVTINSGCRCKRHNDSIPDAAVDSPHIFGIAADIRVAGIHADFVADYLEAQHPDRYGIGRYIGRTHIDVRATKARWDRR